MGSAGIGGVSLREPLGSQKEKRCVSPAAFTSGPGGSEGGFCADWCEEQDLRVRS